jgi:thiamine kinase-like enzyme
MIPEAKNDAVARALREAFGVSGYDDIRIVTGGMTTARVFRIVVAGHPYLLRLITSTDATPGPGQGDPTHQFAEALARLPGTLQRLHALPPFPRPVNYYFDTMDGFIRKFQTARILPESETAELFELYARVANVYPRDDSAMVPSHNDLKPENILFDGDRVWLVDWEAAFSNDRYTDLAVVANFVVTNDAEGEAYLQTLLRRSGR